VPTVDEPRDLSAARVVTGPRHHLKLKGLLPCSIGSGARITDDDRFGDRPVGTTSQDKGEYRLAGYNLMLRNEPNAQRGRTALAAATYRRRRAGTAVSVHGRGDRLGSKASAGNAPPLPVRRGSHRNVDTESRGEKTHRDALRDSTERPLVNGVGPAN
jgi:hypothetical protein